MEEDMINKYFEPCTEEDYGCQYFTATEMINVCESFMSKQRLYHKKFGQILRKLGFNRVNKRGIGYVFFAKRKNTI
jgi:hypothetical protein